MHEGARAVRRRGGRRGRHERGVRCAAADPDLEIVAFDKGGFASYSKCGMPYIVGGVVGDRRRLIARTVEQFGRVRVGTDLGSDELDEKPRLNVWDV